jgi:hypothetical protein
MLQKNVPPWILSSSTLLHWVSRRFHLTSSNKMGWIHVVTKSAFPPCPVIAKVIFSSVFHSVRFTASTLKHNTLLQSFQIFYASKVLVLQLPITFHVTHVIRCYSELFHPDFIPFGTKYEFYTASRLCGSSQVYQSCTIINIETLLYLNIVGVHVTDMLVIYL